MDVEITKYIPSEKRLDIAQEVVKEKGIRPLARELDVNPKSVYKYKNGNAHPGDEVMSKILSIAENDTEVDLNDHFNELRDNFLSAVEAGVDQFTAIENEDDDTNEKEEAEDQDEVSQERSVGSGSTEGSESSESVDEEPTESLGLDEICERIDVMGPFNRTKVEKLLGALDELQEPKIDGLIEESNLSQGAVEDYLEKLRNQSIIEKSNEETYKVKVDISQVD